MESSFTVCSQFLAESSFFVKVSEQRQQNKQQQNQLVSVDSPEENVEICSVPSSVESMLFSYEIPYLNMFRFISSCNLTIV